MTPFLDNAIREHWDFKQEFHFYTDYRIKRKLIEACLMECPQLIPALIDRHAERCKEVGTSAFIISRAVGEQDTKDDAMWLLAGEDVTLQVIRQHIADMEKAENNLAGEQWWASIDADEEFQESFN